MIKTTNAIRIPSAEQKFSQPNTSDKVGNIWYSKNINLKENGYVKLSPRSVALISDSTLDSPSSTDFGLVASFGRYTLSSTYLLGTITNPFTASISTTSFTSALDAGAGVPAASVETRGTWWQDRWYMTTSTKLYYKTLAGGAWTDTGITLTSGIKHPVCLFASLNYLCVGNGNTVQLIDTAHSLVRTLTVPANYQITSMAYSNQRVGIVTQLSTTSLRQNQDVNFFIWDGASTAANSGFPVGSDEVLSVVPYKSSYAFLTRTGQLKYFNGGGFEVLGVLPILSKDNQWIRGDMIGDTLVTDNDNIFINITGALAPVGRKQESFQQNHNGGILCYDPNVGIYHTASPSISVASQVTVTSANVNTTTNIITSTAGTLPQSGNPIKYIYNTSAEIGGLQAGTVYYIIRIDSTHFKLATTRDNAINGVAIDITGTGDTNNYFLALNVLDYGQSLSSFTGGMAVNDSRDLTYDQLVFSTRCYNVAGTAVNYAQLTVLEFDNIGYFVTPVIQSQNIEDNYQKVFLKFAALKDNDTITVKSKYEDVVGLPVSTPQVAATNTWLDTNTFTTTADISEAYTYLQTAGNELECEILSGAGAGQLSQISSITYSAPTYTVNLSDNLEGVAVGNTLNFIIDNFKSLGTATVADTKNWKEFPLNRAGKWNKIKVIMKGTNVTVEEMQVLPSTQIESV